jgi:hypothetical protein
MATAKKTAKKAAPAKAAKKAAPAAKPAKKVAAPKAAPKKKVEGIESLDRRGLALKARQLKTELMSIRFNLQAPSLKDYRKKKAELVQVLAQLG